MLVPWVKTTAKSQNAFSQTELVVVLGVISMLLAIVISARAAPRNRVYQITDAKNHRLIMQAMTSFTMDNSDLLPNPGWGDSQKCWLFGTNLVLGGTPNFGAYQSAYQQQLTTLTNSQLFGYLQDSRVFMCPADRPDNFLFWERYVYISSYEWNAAVDGYGAIANAQPSAYKLSQFRPDAILQWEADETVPFDFNDASSFPDEGISSRHGTNILFGMFGGGVGTVSTATWYGNTMAGSENNRGNSIPNSSLPNRLWCNPEKANGLP